MHGGGFGLKVAVVVGGQTADIILGVGIVGTLEDFQIDAGHAVAGDSIGNGAAEAAHVLLLAVDQHGGFQILGVAFRDFHLSAVGNIAGLADGNLVSAGGHGGIVVAGAVGYAGGEGSAILGDGDGCAGNGFVGVCVDDSAVELAVGGGGGQGHGDRFAFHHEGLVDADAVDGGAGGVQAVIQVLVHGGGAVLGFGAVEPAQSHSQAGGGIAFLILGANGDPVLFIGTAAAAEVDIAVELAVLAVDQGNVEFTRCPVQEVDPALQGEQGGVDGGGLQNVLHDAELQLCRDLYEPLCIAA